MIAIPVAIIMTVSISGTRYMFISQSFLARRSAYPSSRSEVSLRHMPEEKVEAGGAAARDGATEAQGNEGGSATARDGASAVLGVGVLGVG